MIYFEFSFSRLNFSVQGIADNFNISRENFIEALREIAFVCNTMDLIKYDFMPTLYICSSQEYNGGVDNHILNTFKLKFLSPWDLKIGSQIFDLRTI